MKKQNFVHTPKAYLNVNFQLSVEDFKMSPDELYDNVVLPSFEAAVERNDKLIVQFGSLRPSLDYLHSTFGKLAQIYSIAKCKEHLLFTADYHGAAEMVDHEIFVKFKKK